MTAVCKIISYPTFFGGGTCVPSCTNLGIALLDGTGVEMDREEVRKWLKKGVEAGDELALRKLSILDLENGRPIFFGDRGLTLGFSDD